MNIGAMATVSMTLGLAGFLAGCVGSDAPVIPASEAIFDARLVGTWAEDDGTSRHVISRVDGHGNAYVIERVFDDGHTVQDLAYLGYLGGHLVLEVSPDFTDGAPSSDVYVLAVLQFISASESVEGREALQVSMLSNDVLLEALESGEVHLAHRVIGSMRDIVLEDSTDVLRDRLATYLELPGVLEPAFEPFYRIVDPSLAEPRYTVTAPCLQASPWPEADQLFRRDRGWLGADAASSLELADGSILWVFDNTRHSEAARGRWGEGMQIGVTVAIQHGKNPAASPMTFHRGVTAHGEPSAFFPTRDGEELRFGGGVRLDDRLLLFFKRQPLMWWNEDPRYTGWTAMLVDNAYDEPKAWRIRELHTSDDPMGVVLGAAGVLRLGGHVYAMGSPRHLESAPVFVARWSVERASEGDLDQSEWWAGEELGWVAEASSVARVPLFEGGPGDLHIQSDPGSGLYFAVQGGGSGTPMTVRASSALLGEWSAPAPIQLPSGLAQPGESIRQARMHPALAAAGRLLTVRTKNWYPWETQHASRFPRFLRLNHCTDELLQAGSTVSRFPLLAWMTTAEDSQ
jgi:hypothetical protein